MRVDPSKIIPTSDDTSERWVAFHKALKSWFGKAAANSYFVKFWNQRAGAGSSADTHDLREYMNSQGVNLQTDFAGDVVDFEMGIVDWFGDTANVLRAVIFGTVIVGVGLIAYYMIKGTNHGKSMGEMVAPVRGRRIARGAYGFPNQQVFTPQVVM